MLTASESGLVNGMSPVAMEKPSIVSVKVLRAFLLKLDRQEAGAVISIDRRLAQELASANKVEILKPAVVDEADKVEPAAVKPAFKAGKKGA